MKRGLGGVHGSRCDGVTRRDVLRVGGISAFGLGLGDLAQLSIARARAAELKGTARSCILIWLDGGPSHLETFDVKPEAPAEVRGPLSAIPTAVAGLRFSECLPRTAGIADQLTVIRSVTSPLGEHNFATHYLLTGYRPSPALEYPAIGSTVAHLRSGADSILPANIAVPDYRVGGGRLTGHGYLPAATQPFSLGSDPAKPGFQVRDLEFYTGLSGARMARRKAFLNRLDGLSETLETGGDSPSDPVFEQAFRLISAPEARQAFDLSDEPASLRARYGGRTIGASCLLARRLVERGVPFVTVNDRGWDTHDNLYTRLKEGYTGAKDPVGLIPSLDLALSALVTDLRERGLLERTLVLVMGEFGRTPKLNTSGGRDHWPRVFSVVMAGGGVPGGLVLGSSDATGESPQERPVSPADIAHTVYRLLGIDPAHALHTADERPIRVGHVAGHAIPEIVSG
jgi:hypothetical protein